MDVDVVGVGGQSALRSGEHSGGAGGDDIIMYCAANFERRGWRFSEAYNFVGYSQRYSGCVRERCGVMMRSADNCSAAVQARMLRQATPVHVGGDVPGSLPVTALLL